MKKVVLIALACTCALVVAAAGGAAASFADPAGDADGAPDLSGIQISNDAAGVITFQIGLASGASIAADSLVALNIDSDGDLDTGDGAGFDTTFLFASGKSLTVLRWNGSNYATGQAPTATVSAAANTLRLTVNKRDLADTKAFAFYLTSAQIGADDEIVASDDAPDDGEVWEYELTAPTTVPPTVPPPAPPTGTLTLSSSKPAAAMRAKAGKPFAVTMGVKRGDTGAAVTTGKVTCAMKIGTRPVRSTGRFLAGKARCTATLPATARGKTLRGTITVTLGTAKTAKAFAFRVA